MTNDRYESNDRVADLDADLLSGAAARNEIAAIRLFLRDQGMLDEDTILNFLRGWKLHGRAQPKNFISNPVENVLAACKFLTWAQRSEVVHALGDMVDAELEGNPGGRT